MELDHCFGENGHNCDYAVIGHANLTSIEEETGQSGVPYVRASVAVSEQSARRNQFLEINYGNEDTVWISVTTFFGKDGAPGRAGYLLNQLQNRGVVKSVRVIPTGTISVNKWTDKKPERFEEKRNSLFGT